jgi:hypothetical protein
VDKLGDPMPLATQPIASMTQQFGILSRAPQRILAAQTGKELRETLGSCLRGLYPRVLEFELYSRD